MDHVTRGRMPYIDLHAATAGKASFGFVSKYHNGASKPSGNTEFHFKAGDLRFSSTSYDWLVVAGIKAKYKGKGTINGSGQYGFMITAVDGKNNGSDDSSGSRSGSSVPVWSSTTTRWARPKTPMMQPRSIRAVS